MKKNYTISFLFLLSFCFSGYHSALQAQSLQIEQEQIEWISIEEALERSKTEPRKILVDVFLKNDNWCQKMDGVTYKNKQIVKYINAKYYAIKFDAETKEAVEYKGKNYSGAEKNGYHELGIHFTDGAMSFPSFSFLDENFEVIQAFSGFKHCMEFEMFLTFYGENKYEEKSWSKHKKQYTPLRILEKEKEEEAKRKKEEEDKKEEVKNKKRRD